jgi:hypothetical protein
MSMLWLASGGDPDGLHRNPKPCTASQAVQTGGTKDIVEAGSASTHPT